MSSRDVFAAIVMGCVLVFVGIAILAGNGANVSTATWLPMLAMGLGFTGGGLAVLGATFKSLF